MPVILTRIVARDFHLFVILFFIVKNYLLLIYSSSQIFSEIATELMKLSQFFYFLKKDGCRGRSGPG
jgi:hypothetical protein